MERVDGEAAKEAKEASLEAVIGSLREEAGRFTEAAAPAATSPTGAHVGSLPLPPSTFCLPPVRSIPSSPSCLP